MQSVGCTKKRRLWRICYGAVQSRKCRIFERKPPERARGVVLAKLRNLHAVLLFTEPTFAQATMQCAENFRLCVPARNNIVLLRQLSHFLKPLIVQIQADEIAGIEK